MSPSGGFRWVTCMRMIPPASPDTTHDCSISVPTVCCSACLYFCLGVPMYYLQTKIAKEKSFQSFKQECIPVGGCVYPSMHWAKGVCIPACTGQGGVSAWGCLSRGCGRHTPGTRSRHPPGKTDTCENMTFANFVCGR